MSFNNALHFVQLLKREPALLNAHQVPIAICSCMAIKKPRVSNVKAVRHVYPEEAKSPEARSVYACTLQHHSVGVQVRSETLVSGAYL